MIKGQNVVKFGLMIDFDFEQAKRNSGEKTARHVDLGGFGKTCRA